MIKHERMLYDLANYIKKASHKVAGVKVLTSLLNDLHGNRLHWTLGKIADKIAGYD